MSSGAKKTATKLRNSSFEFLTIWHKLIKLLYMQERGRFIMFKVKTFVWENGQIITREKVFYAIEKAMLFYEDVKTLVTHGKLICHNRVTNEF